ncbi:MAG TPA: response regulator [Candidatus Acidoferrales bacterium]|nr:response regulator [Candidatus Acidoferrales bacterium]
MNTMTRLFDLRKSQKPARSRPESVSAMTEPATDKARAEVAAIMAKIENTEHSGHSGQSGKATIAGLAAKQDRRHRRRVKISAPVRIRHTEMFQGNEFDLTMTIDVSREGVLFESSHQNYVAGQEVAIVFPYAPASWEPVKEQRGQVVRVARSSEKRFSIAVAFLEGTPHYELVDAQGRSLAQPPEVEKPASTRNQRPLILVVDEDPRARLLLRTQLEADGYTVEAVADPAMAVTLLRHRSPVTLICEAEAFPGSVPNGEMSGYDLCVIVRRNPKYSQMPVILTTRTGLPSDFATAHALGATVCVAKPYDLERVANLVRMLAPVDAA